jgi:FMN reductase (NADPH)
MNETLRLIHRHRSIRRYAATPVPAEDVRTAVAAGQAASTSSAVQAYALIQVTDPDERRTLAELTGPQEKVERCGAFFVVCGDTRRHRLATTRSGRAYEARLEAYLLAVIDATLFAQNLVLAFESLGYGICYIGGLRNQLADVDALLEIPEGVYPLYGLCVGVPAEEPSARPRLPVEAVLFEGRYPDDATMRARLDDYDAAYLDYLDDRGVAADRRRTWTDLMADKFAATQRPDVGAYYRSKGADLS